MKILTNTMKRIQKLWRKKTTLNINANPSSFFPRKELEGKSNYKRYFRIERDGNTTEHILLHVPDIRLREQIICTHFLSFITKNILKEETGVVINSRDDPWDFSLELSNGSTFNLEIVSIANNKWSFEKSKREEVLEEAETKTKIRLRELIKYASWQGDQSLEELADKYKSDGVGLNDLIKNPLYERGTVLFLSHSGEEPDDVANLISTAILNKQNKPHTEKENTVLVIDNRTSCFRTSEFQDALHQLKELIKNSPFPELYLYTGYYSDDDGNNAEYSFMPLKIPKDKNDALQAKIDSGKFEINEYGVLLD